MEEGLEREMDEDVQGFHGGWKMVDFFFSFSRLKHRVLFLPHVLSMEYIHNKQAGKLLQRSMEKTKKTEQRNKWKQREAERNRGKVQARRA